MTSTPASPEPTAEGAPKAADASETTGLEPGEVQQSSPGKSSASSPSDSADSASSRASPSPAKPTQTETEAAPTAPPLPNEPVPGTESNTSSADGPPLPDEPVPEPEDDGWEAHWNPNTNSFWFYNRFTGVWQQENPRVPDATAAAAVTAPVVVPETADKSTISNPVSVAGGYNPAIHGDYDENAWYAQNARAVTEPAAAATSVGMPAVGEAGADYATGAHFNRWTGQWQAPDQGVERHTDEAKSRRQMNAYFDVDAAANMHDGRSLKAERAGKKPTKAELKMFKEKRKAKKEEKRRAWLRD
jgi:hypothetical protein